ncbi:alpha/beta hydrolase [Devriesea agamarum]|uniref:alpha/beta hydrolase n=1 Tax=Devriesea agamarum TaxID=472569 RepID=UPI00071D3B30|nr:alpha/beta-hydrolase family protein [Devriesea agamarum]
MSRTVLDRVAQMRPSSITAPLASAGVVGASAATWVATSPSLIPRTWWSTAANVGLSQVYGYVAGKAGAQALKVAARALGVKASIKPEGRNALRWIGAASFVGMSAYSWVRGEIRQREITRLVFEEPKQSWTQAAGVGTGIALSCAVLASVRGILIAHHALHRAIGHRLPGPVGQVVSLAAIGGLGVVAGERLVRGELLQWAIHQAERTNSMIAPGSTPPRSTLRSGSAESLERWQTLGAAGRRIVTGGPSAEQIARVTGAPAMEPIRVYAGKMPPGRSLDEAVDIVLAELDRTGAWDRRVLAIFTGTGTGWLQEWSLSAIEYLTGGNCATASLQYSVYTSGLSYILDRQAPRAAGQALFQAVRQRLDLIPKDKRPRLFVAGESLGSYGGQAAFASPEDLLSNVDGAVWTGTPRFTPLWQQFTARRRGGSPEVAPIVDDGRHVRFITHPDDLVRNFWGGPYEPWEAPRIVYAQHASDPVVWWSPRLLWEEPDWLRQRVGKDVSPAVRWFPWVTFWQIAADMPLSISVPGGHGHSYREAMVPIWAAVLGEDPRQDRSAIVDAIRASM